MKNMRYPCTSSVVQKWCHRGSSREQGMGNVGGEGGEDGMLEDVAIGGSWGAGLRSGEEGMLVLLGAVTNQLAWCSDVTHGGIVLGQHVDVCCGRDGGLGNRICVRDGKDEEPDTAACACPGLCHEGRG